MRSLQINERLPLHVGGIFALSLQGHEHYLRLGEPAPVTLYGAATLPGWASKLPLPQAIEFLGKGPFASAAASSFTKRSLTSLEKQGLTQYQVSDGKSPVVCATPERAILELCGEVSDAAGVYQADALLQGMTTLRPRRISALLKQCQSVKAKRVFLALSERHGHAWLARLALDDLDLGRGKRSLVPNGRLHPRYQITLPTDLDEHLA